jgi:hypothetical protein
MSPLQNRKIEWAQATAEARGWTAQQTYTGQMRYAPPTQTKGAPRAAMTGAQLAQNLDPSGWRWAQVGDWALNAATYAAATWGAVKAKDALDEAADAKDRLVVSGSGNTVYVVGEGGTVRTESNNAPNLPRSEAE